MRTIEYKQQFREDEYNINNIRMSTMMVSHIYDENGFSLFRTEDMT